MTCAMRKISELGHGRYNTNSTSILCYLNESKNGDLNGENLA